MKLAYVALKYDYGQESRGPSYEFDNLESGFLSWANSRNDLSVECFHPDVEGEMDILMERVGDFDAIFHVAFNDSLDLPLEIAQKAIELRKRVIQWDCDSSWRFQNWVLGRKHRVTDFVTTHSSTVEWYRAYGLRVFKSQWGGSPLYNHQDLEKIYDVSFVGQKHGIRPQILQGFYNAGIKVDLFGNYWDDYPNWHGYLATTEEKVRAINQSKICLNLSNPHQVGTLPQIKGRHFEIPQCKAFQLSTPADDLHSYFVPDKEIVIANSMPEMIDKVKYYLNNDQEREDIASAGYQRMCDDHSWSSRFERLFFEMRLM